MKQIIKLTLATFIFLTTANIIFAQQPPTASTGCVSGNCVNGRGKIVDDNGNTYEGNWVNGKKEGQGTLTIVNFGVYVGQFANDVPSGKGKFSYTNGNIFEGNWVNDVIEGQGIYTFKTGDYYVGSWENGKLNGFGKIYTKSTNTLQEGIWKNDAFVSSTAAATTTTSPTSTGCVSGNCVNGYGKYVFDGGSYEGNFVNGKREGQGILINTNFGVYVGQFANDVPSGKGKFSYTNGNIFEGNWVNDVIQGQGIYTFKNGDYYIGSWENGKLNGYGKVYTKSTNNLQEGTWKNDTFVSSTSDTTSASSSNARKPITAEELRKAADNMTPELSQKIDGVQKSSKDLDDAAEKLFFDNLTRKNDTDDYVAETNKLLTEINSTNGYILSLSKSLKEKLQSNNNKYENRKETIRIADLIKQNINDNSNKARLIISKSNSYLNKYENNKNVSPEIFQRIKTNIDDSVKLLDMLRKLTKEWDKIRENA